MTRPSPRNRPGPMQRRHGLAMMMVLFSVVMATILATAYLVSRDSSVLIARNNTAAAEARYASLAGRDTALAILQTEVPWRTAHTGGVLVEDYAFAQGILLTIEAHDIEEDGAPNSESEYVKLTATTKVDVNGDGVADGGDETVVIAYVPKITADRVVADLADFVVFVRETLLMHGNATIARWPKAPLTTLGRRIMIGTHSTSSGAIVLADNAACIDCTVWIEQFASPSAITNLNGPAIDRQEMFFQIPFPASPDHGEPNPSGGEPDLDMSAENAMLTADARYDDITMLSGSVLTLAGDITVVADDKITLTGNSRILVDGNATIIAFDDLNLSGNSAIEIQPGATVTIFIGNDLNMTDGYIGEERADAVRDHTGSEEYMSPADINMFTIEDTPVGERLWTVQGNSVIKASIYGETLHFKLSDDSALYGRVASEWVNMYGNAAVFYDHALDERAGFTSLSGKLYNPDATQNSAYAGLASLDAVTLQNMADATSTVIVTSRDTFTDSAITPPGPAVVPTPRPVVIIEEEQNIGDDMTEWEDEAVSAGLNPENVFDSVATTAGKGNQSVN